MKKSTIIFLKYTNKFLKNNFFLKKNSNYFLAFSGGQDSICLVIIFFILQKQFKIKIHILFCNHLWQNESFFIFSHVLKISFFLNLHISQSITNNFLLTENLSRTWRFEIFSKFLFFFNYSAIISGHSLNDKNETFFFNILRGSGSFGIYSLQKKKNWGSKLLKLKHNSQNLLFSTKKRTFSHFLQVKKKFIKQKINDQLLEMATPIQGLCQCKLNYKVKKKLFFFQKKGILNFFILRPFIFLTRTELKFFLIKLKLPVFPDITNQEIFLSRNRIRKQLIPTIRFFFNKQINFSINKYINIIYQKEKEIYIFIENFYHKIFYENINFFFINYKLLRKLPSFCRNNIFIFFFKYKLKKNLNYENFKKFIILVGNYKKKFLLKKNIQILSPIGIYFFYSNFLIFIKK